MTVSALSPISLAQFFYPSGKLVRPARLYFYKPSTEDPYTVYTEPTLGVPHEQPVLSGGSGRVPPIYIGEDPYKIRVFDSYGSLIEDIDYLPGAFAATEGGGGGGTALPGELLQTGDMFFSFTNAVALPRTGCVRANGGLICPVGFDSTAYPGQVERRNDDTHDLFVWLWGQDLVNSLEVIGGKGPGSAEDDWVANKAIRLPDARGSMIIGLDGMGQPLASSIPPLSVQHPLPGVTDHPGAWGGSGFTTQALAQMPSHSHDVNANTTGIVSGGATNQSVTGVTTATKLTGVTVNYGVTSLGINRSVTGISISNNYAGASMSQLVHYHTYEDSIPERASLNLSAAALGDDGPLVMTMSGRADVAPFTIGNTSSQLANITFTDGYHSHGYIEPAGGVGHFHGITEPNGGIGHNHGITETAHNHTVVEPNAGLGHSHTITETAHSHTTVAAGGGEAMTTISPFLTAIVYIKL